MKPFGEPVDETTEIEGKLFSKWSVTTAMNDTSTPVYWTLGYMIERKQSSCKHVKGSIFINFENFLDVRQSRFEPLMSGTDTQSIFVTGIYAPTDVRIINEGIINLNCKCSVDILSAC